MNLSARVSNLACCNGQMKLAKNSGRMGKTLWTSAGAGSMIHLIGCEDQNDESRRIVDTVQRAVARGEAKYRDFAILYRMNAQSQNIEKAFARAAVPGTPAPCLK